MIQCFMLKIQGFFVKSSDELELFIQSELTLYAQSVKYSSLPFQEPYLYTIAILISHLSIRALGYTLFGSSSAFHYN